MHGHDREDRLQERVELARCHHQGGTGMDTIVKIAFTSG
jgi:hypothetical protein